eukprot:5907008-Pleurochrysis_carterae.AAC.1
MATADASAESVVPVRALSRTHSHILTHTHALTHTFSRTLTHSHIHYVSARRYVITHALTSHREATAASKGTAPIRP